MWPCNLWLGKGSIVYKSILGLESPTISIHAELIERAIRNDPEAQFDLYKKYNAAMYNTALRICRNTALAEDVIQESFLNAFNSLGYYRGDASFGSWLKRIVINKAISLSKKESRWELVENDEVLDTEETVIEASDYDVDTVRLAINELPDGFRTVLSLYLLEGYDHKEIAEILGITESTSKTQYKRAKERLRVNILEKMKHG
jgi:RNA polymerase sigma-70 factor (ECF subfamily)